MELKLEVVVSSSIKRKKPWPRFCWLGREKESVFLLDDKRISEINMVSGRTKKKTPKLHPLLNSVLRMSSSHNGMWLCGLLVSGELFLWNRDKDLLKTAAAVSEVVEMITGNTTRLSLQVSGDGMRVLLVAITGQVFLWECVDVRDLMGVRDGTVKGQWTHIQPLEDSVLPSEQDKDASQHTVFMKTEVMGDACLTAFVFTSAKKLIITCLRVQWEEVHVRVGSIGYSIQWVTKTYPMTSLTPPCQTVKSRGALVPAFSPDGSLLAIVLNQRQPQATQVLFVSTQNFVSISGGLGGCGSKKMEIPSKYIRSYWVGSVSWSPSGLFLACVLKRGSLLMLSRLGGLLTLSSSGCNVDFGPAHFLPLHPLVTYRPPVSAGNKDASLSSSSLSVRDVLRQRYSVTWHPRLFYLIVSDGYMATVMRVLDKPSPALLLEKLLKDTSKDLEKASRVLDKSQIHVRAWLESVSCLNLDRTSEVLNPTFTPGLNTAESVISAATDGSTLPPFLQDQGTLGGTKELFEKMQAFFEEDSDLEGPPAGSYLEDRGHLEFASMFDTLHAQETNTDIRLITSPDSEKDFAKTKRRTSKVHLELGNIQRKLLTAWALGLSLGNAVENRPRLLKHTLLCVVRLAALLRLFCEGKTHTSFSSCLLNLLQNVLSFLPWDGAHSDGPRGLGLTVELSKRLIHLYLTPHPESQQAALRQLSSRSLSSVLLILQLVSDSLDRTYSLQRRTFWTSGELPRLWPSDVHHVAMLHDGKEEETSLTRHSQPVPQRPSSRLLGVWQWVYKIGKQYAEELRSFQGSDGFDEEQNELSVIMSHVQTALQATGERLEEAPTLLSYPGEHLFLLGSYAKSADTWRSQICEESSKRSHRSVFKETRLCLALLYSLLSEYRLREAQELGDHVARLILLRVGHQEENLTCVGADSPPCPWLPVDLHSDTACAVLQTLGRFMASYFTNQPLHILPPHHVAVLPPLHLPHAPTVGRLVPLCQEEVAKAVRLLQLSEVWTVDYALDLLLLGGLLPEATWLAYHVGDWKTAASLSLAYTSFCSDHFDFTRLRRGELHLPTDLEPESIFQVELECILGNKSDSQELRDKNGNKSFADTLEAEDWDLLQAAMQEILKASVMAGVNVTSSPLSSLLNAAKEACSLLPAVVPNGLYLPSPPLYCPQPSPNTQDPVGTTGQFEEVASRHKVSRILQRLLLLLKSARCCRPAAQWYIGQLRRARHILHKIKKKYSYPPAAEEETAFPEGLMKFVTRSGFFRRGANQEAHLDPDTIQTVACFRELCALCWMLHIRDQLSISCRKYQAARQRVREEQITNDSEIRSTCVSALLWARRLLPFSHFLDVEEILQDILLSLLSELPPLSLVADTLVQIFPEEEESVRVALREKYNSLLQRLRQCNVLEGEEGEVMMVVIQDKRRQRRKHLGRLKRHMAPPELHLWEEEEEEEEARGSRRGMEMLRRLSLGTTLSTSTLTDCAYPPLCSDGDTADNTSEAQSPEPRTSTRSEKAKKKRDGAKKAAVKIDSVIREESHPDDAREKEQPQPPIVGAWEFELEDEEYLNFLELFLSYVLEKERSDGAESGGELPLLKSFSPQLRERELHSLAFDVLTTIHRRQRDLHHSPRKHPVSDLPVFRAGCCYKSLKPELQTPSLWSEAPVSRTNLSVSSLPGLRGGRQKGLFGLRKQSSVLFDRSTTEGLLGFGTSPNRSPFLTRKQSESFTYASSSMETVIDLQQGLDPKLEAQFPELGRLLEWMVRWADKRVLVGHRGKKRRAGGEGAGGTAGEGVMIRVKASAPAILTSLGVLQSRFTARLGSECDSARIQIPETEWTVAPVLQPEAERGSSADTGYPGSATTPITGLDLHPLELPVASGTDELEEPHSTTLPIEQEEVSVDARQRLSTSHHLRLDDLDVTPEKEGQSSNSEGLEVSSPVSNGNMPDTSLKLADLDVNEDTDDMSSSTSLPSQIVSLHAPPHPEPQALPPVQPEPEVHAERSGLPEVLFPSAPTHPSHPAPTEASVTPSQPLSTENPQMRQRLGEDLYRLVQNINYMSLMEVLGASFSNLQLAQQSSSLAQSNMNSSHLAPSFIPQPNAFPPQTNIPTTPQTQGCLQTPASRITHQTPACASADPPDSQNSGKTSPASSRCQISMDVASSTSNIAGVDYQALSVQAESPEIQFRESSSLIPPSQGLLTTSQCARSTHVLPPSTESLQNETTAQVTGLKLLQLHRPPSSSQQISQHHPQTLHTSHPSRRTEKEKRSVSTYQKTHLGFNHTPDPTPAISQHNIRTSARSREHDFSLLPPAFPAHTPAPMQGLRLLHCEPVSHNSVAFPKIPVRPFSRSVSAVSTPRGEPQIKLLHLEPGPKMMFPTTAPSAQIIRLMSMEELTRSVVARQNSEEARLRLLRVDLPPESSRRDMTALSSDSSKRQKRRMQKAEREEKAEVTFRPNDSIIPTQEQTNEPDKLAAAEEVSTGQDVSAQSGFFDSNLTGQRLLDRAMSTSAELHAFASTCKNPPECHDACTNTDPAKSPGQLHFSKQHHVEGTEETTQGLEENLDLNGQQFISVLDLEESLHQDLPPCLSPAALNVPSSRLPSPTSAQLHVLATSVLSRAAADPQPSVTIQEVHMQATPHTGIPEELPSCSHYEPVRVPERITTHDPEDPSVSEICQAIQNQSIKPPSASSTPPTVWFSSHLSELDCQLAALQSIADNLERDFSNSRMLVNTNAKLTPALASDVKSPTAVKKTVRLSVPQEAWMPKVDPLNAVEEEEEEENLEEEIVIQSSSRTPERIRTQLTDASGTSAACADEDSGLTGLSDTAEILDELVREGYLSLNDLELSQPQTAHPNSMQQRQQQSGWTSQKRVRPEDERRELRIWMRRKQREQLAVYQKHRQSLREREHRPFSSSGTAKSTQKNETTVWRTREEREKFTLLEQYNQRTREAFSLAWDFSDPPTTRLFSRTEVSPVPSASRSNSAPPPGSTYRVFNVSANDERSLESGRAQPHSRPWTADMPSTDDRRRLGLHRPVTSLPSDRLSQVTRRGMITDPKSKSKALTSSQSQERQFGQQEKTGPNNSLQTGKAVGRGILRETRMEDTAGLNTSDLDTLLGQEEANRVGAALLDEEDDGCRAGVSDMDWLDNLSENGSSLSKIDWAAIERMVAAEDA